MIPEIRQLFDNNLLGVVATVNEDGSPWASPVHMVSDGEAVYWFSKDSATHSQNVIRDPRVSVSLFSADTSHGLKGVYIQGVAEMLAEADRQKAFELLADRIGREHIPASFHSATGYRVPIGTLDEQKSTDGCWYFYS